MRIRTVKPEFWESESVGGVSRDARLLFIGLFNLADDSGRFRAASRFLASRLFPYDTDAPGLLEAWIEELRVKKHIQLYEVDGETFGVIPKFTIHQKIDHPSPSKLPAPTNFLANPREGSREVALDQGTGIREQGSGNREGAAAPPRASALVAVLPAPVVKDSVKEQQQKLFAAMLQYLNEKSGRKFMVSPGLMTRIRGGASEADIRLVIDFLAQRVQDRPTFWARYFDNETPFRISHFDKYRAAAEVWDKAGRGPSDEAEDPARGARDRAADHRPSSPETLAKYGI